MDTGRLKHITFTGVDEKTDVNRLIELQRRYPLVEFGLLLSKNYQENGNRYMNPEYFRVFKNLGLNLSCHICGSVARAAILDDFSLFESILGDNISIFSRMQLNISTNKKNPEKLVLNNIPETIKEVIIQQKSVDDCELFKSGLGNPKLSMLADASGGTGKDTGLSLMRDCDAKVGYAGGFGPENVEEKLSYILDNVQHDFWIDMEGRVRTADWFDLDKVEEVLEICYKVINR